MAESFLPEEKWIYCTKNREEKNTGMWIYICSDPQGNNTPQFSSFIKTMDATGQDISKQDDAPNAPGSETIIDTVKVISDVNPIPTPLEILINQPTSMTESQIPIENKPPSPFGPSELTIMNPVTPIKLQAEMTIEESTSMDNIIDKTLSSVQVQPEESMKISSPFENIREKIPPLTIKLPQVEKSQPDVTTSCSITPMTLGLNHPQVYHPTICIESPKCDPEKKSRKRKHCDPGYDPERPAIGKNYRCDICDKSFATKGSLSRHNQSNHSDESFECEECGQKILRKDSIKRHYRKYHTGIPFPKHLIVNNTKGNTAKIVNFNVRSKSPIPKSQFADKKSQEHREDILNKIMETLLTYKQ